MLCKCLEDGMLVKIVNPDKKGWFNHRSQERLKKKFLDIPPKFVIGPDIISYLMRMDGISSFVNPGECFIYLGKKKILSKKGTTKTFRLVFVNGKVGFIEGKDVRHLEPA